MGLKSKPELRARACAGKKREPSRLSAKLAAERLGETTANAYRCPHCGFWHVGNQGMREPRHQPYKRDKRIPAGD